MSGKSKLILIVTVFAVILVILLLCLLPKDNHQTQMPSSPTVSPAPESTVTPTASPSTPAPTETPVPETPAITPPAVFSVDTSSASDILIQIILPSSDSDISLPEEAE